MKAKLIKIEEGYELLTQGFLKGSTNHELIDSLNVEEGNIRYKLSLKNCQAIECGYDLDELVDEFIGCPEDMRTLSEDWRINSFKSGFQKALELMGDKTFSEEDLRLAMHFGRFGEANNQTTTIGFIQSLQQTEWDVEIEIYEEKEFIFDPAMGISQGHYLDKPKLDADGCLILKKITNEN